MSDKIGLAGRRLRAALEAAAYNSQMDDITLRVSHPGACDRCGDQERVALPYDVVLVSGVRYSSLCNECHEELVLEGCG